MTPPQGLPRIIIFFTQLDIVDGASRLDIVDDRQLVDGRQLCLVDWRQLGENCERHSCSGDIELSPELSS